MSFDGWEYAFQLGGAIMVTAGLFFMMDIIMEQRKDIDVLLTESKNTRENPRTSQR